ncbi:MAG: ribonuclease HI [Clostridia bacterium]|nr:ribonuclease HI [Clostridia bacterium]
MKGIVIYTDGACSGNPGKGGWCAILSYKGHEKMISGGEKETTNNRMELSAVCRGLAALNTPCEVEVYSDSAYVVNAVTNGWLYNWLANGWKTSDKKDVKNVDLWQELLSLFEVHTVTFNKVKGHADDELNNRCDKEARAQALKQ